RGTEGHGQGFTTADQVVAAHPDALIRRVDQATASQRHGKVLATRHRDRGNRPTRIDGLEVEVGNAHRARVDDGQLVVVASTECIGVVIDPEDEEHFTLGVAYGGGQGGHAVLLDHRVEQPVVGQTGIGGQIETATITAIVGLD